MDQVTRGKEEVLADVAAFAANHELTKEELLATYDQAVATKPDTAVSRQLSIAEILYYLGGGIVFLGIAVLIGQNWSVLSDFTKILATLGSGLAAYVVGVIFSREEKLDRVGQAFFFISALVMPLGLFVVFEGAELDITGAGVNSLIAAILLVTFLTSYFVFRKTLFIIFSIIFGTWLFFAFTDYMIGGGQAYYEDLSFIEYRVLAVGLTYMLLGYYFFRTGRPLAEPLYAFGTLGFLGAALFLTGFDAGENIFWEVMFPGLAFAVIFLSVHVKSRAFLSLGSLFLMAYIIKISAQYFTDSLGWPVALVFAGLALIGIGYGTYYLNRRYVSNPRAPAAVSK